MRKSGILNQAILNATGSLGHTDRIVVSDAGLPIPLGAVQNARSYVYVGNLADAVLACARHPAAAGRLFLVADAHAWSTPQMVRLIAREMGRPARLLPVPLAALRLLGRLTAKSREIGSLTESLRIDASRLHAATGWSPPYTTEEGVARTVRWHLGLPTK